ncbi:MAG TPA: copper-containing nitrite reductase [Longimicrobiales bacterium]|nr:copper-containing nitrite reductase [Longimicrobiales bacterium]
MKNTTTYGIVGGGALVTALAFAGLGMGSVEEAAVPFPELPEVEGVEMATLTAPPAVPAPIDRDYATTVKVDLEVIEEVREIAPGVEYEFWTFGGTVPGSFIRVREGDMVEFKLSSRDDSSVPHNIDLHAVTGPHGGGSSSFVMAGDDATFSFRALKPGLYVYHCAMNPVPVHIANGMYGLILVEPKDGLPEVDHEFYVMQGDFYVDAKEPGLQGIDTDKLYNEMADYVLFNGAVDALNGDNAMEVQAGESVRLFMGNGGPNLTSSFHAIGEIFDNVHVEAGSMVNHNVQTTMVPPGGATIAEFRADVPGDILLVDHAISRVFNKGALATVRVNGEEEPRIFAGGGH